MFHLFILRGFSAFSSMVTAVLFCYRGDGWPVPFVKFTTLEQCSFLKLTCANFLVSAYFCHSNLH
uniref:Uncharacterized protein n=1 Tax=Anguilla anguilla TaxID=7936 RepID=A0A0E9WNH2_ANGAN